MGRSRRGRGEGGIEKLPSGKFRAVRAKVVAGKMTRSSKAFGTRGEAQEWLRDQRTPAAAGTLGQWLDTWLALVRPDRAPKTYANYLYRLRRWIRPRLGGVRLRDLTGLSISTMLAGMAAEGASDGERHRVGEMLKTALKAAVGYGQISANPMAGLKMPSIPPNEKRAMLPAELAAMIGAAKLFGLSAHFRLWADAGLRPAEFRALDWDDFDFQAGTLKVKRSLDAIVNRPKEVKTRGSRRTIKLAPSTVKALAGVRPVTGGKFLKNGQGKYYWEASFHLNLWKPIRRAASVGWATPYTFRHTMATLLLRANVPLKVVAERLGHANVTTTLKHYSHVLEGDQERAAAVMEGILNPKTHRLPTGGQKVRKARGNRK